MILGFVAFSRVSCHLGFLGNRLVIDLCLRILTADQLNRCRNCYFIDRDPGATITTGLSLTLKPNCQILGEYEMYLNRKTQQNNDLSRVHLRRFCDLFTDDFTPVSDLIFWGSGLVDFPNHNCTVF